MSLDVVYQPISAGTLRLWVTMVQSFHSLRDLGNAQLFIALMTSRTRLSTVSDRAFPVAAACVWNSLLDLVTSAPSV